MWIRSLSVENFRNYRLQNIDFSPGVNILLGENAQGKTNTLEAVYLLAVGKSHRTSKDADLIQWGEDVAAVTARLQVQEKEQTVDIRIGRTGKKATINGVSLRKMTQFVGQFQAVLFAPEDLALVKGAPAVRRRFLDIELGQTQSAYLFHLARYNKVLQQRNSLLKRPPVDLDLLSALDEQLVHHGAEVLARRLRFLSQLRIFADSTYRSVSDGRERLSIQYVSSLQGAETDQPLDAKVLSELFYKMILAKRDSDLHHGFTNVGPHRDDLVFKLDDRPVHGFASQGQQRTIALALRLAEIDFIYQEVGEYPVLLLDDVLSELDDVRQLGLVLSMSQKVQTIITTTSLYHLEERLTTGAKLFHVRSGIIQEKG